MEPSSPSTIDEREDVQKKTFAKWINSQLAKHGKPPVSDLCQDLRDGEVLLSLLEILTQQQFKRERGRMRVHQLNNVNCALRALAAAGVRLVNISSGDIVDGNPKLVLGLVWSIILHWQVHCHLRELMSDLQQTNLEKALLEWCRTQTEGYEGVTVDNLTSSWADGLALCALLHRLRPRLLDYNSQRARTPHQRLEHAFTIAHKHLGIARLLDPEDVNTPNPDKKSIMMYLMCLFQSQTGETSKADQDEEMATLDVSADTRSRPLSSASVGTGELGAYGCALEDALAALLGGEERLGAPDPPLADTPHERLHQLKARFHAHEKFLLELSEQQGRVGCVLEEGARLIRDAALSRDEVNEIRLQMRLLNQRWETLRLGAMDKQTRVHRDLMKEQADQLNEFGEWLTATEDRMSRMEEAGEPAAALAAAEQLHAELRRQQPLVDALSDAVLVVDESGDEVELEDRLRALGERWSHAAAWTLARLRRLRALLPLDTKLRELQARAHALEPNLKQMEAYPASEIGEVLERISGLQRAAHSLRVLRRELTALIPQVSAVGGAEAGRVADDAEGLHDTLDALQLMLDVQGDRIKELGFEFDINTTEEESSPTAGATITTTMTVDVDRSDADRNDRAKKPRLSETAADFQAGYKVFEDWAEKTEKELDECGRSLQRCDGARRDAAQALLRRVQRESEDKNADLAHVTEIQRRLAADPALREEAKLHAKSIEEVKIRWDGIQKSLLELRNTLNLLEDKENYYKGLEAFQKELEDINSWKDRMLTDPPSNNQLIHLRNRIRMMKQLEVRLKELNAQSIILLTKSISKSHKDEIEADSKRINEAFEELITHLGKREVEIKLALNKKPVVVQTDEYKNVQSKIQEMEAQIMSEHAIVSSKVDMERRLEELKRLRLKFDDMQSSYDTVVKEKREKYEKGSVQDLRSSLENLVVKFSDSKTILEGKINKLQKGIELLSQLEAECTEVRAWLERVNSAVGAVPLGDVDDLTRLLGDSNKFLEEKPTYQSKLDDIETTKDQILEDCEESLAKSITESTKDLKNQFETITKSLLEHNEALRRGLERTENVFSRIEDMEKWLDQLQEEIPKDEECTITDSGQLYQMKTRFQTLKDKCEEKTVEFRDLSEEGNELLEAGERAALARRLTQLSALWTRRTHCVYERYKVLTEAWHESGELRSWLALRGAWLDGLQRRLRPAAPADAEEIADELYELENYLAQRSDSQLERIEAVGRQLADADIMRDSIRHELQALHERWQTLQAQAAERCKALEAAAQEAAAGELALDALLRRLDELLEHPEPADQVWSEIEAARAGLARVATQVEAHRAAGRAPAAARLADRLKLAQSKLEEVESLRGEAGAAGAAWCGRLARARASLHALAADAGALALHAAHPDQVRPQLRRCLRFYRTLSEIKGEVESIIKTGRKMVEEKSIPDPQDFSKKIDELKELYNRLGAHVTESKTKLETALLTAREIQNDVQSLTTWLQGLGNVGKQTLEIEMSRMEAIKDKLNASYVEFAKNCDPVYLENLKEQVDDINSKWDSLKRHGLGKKEEKKETEAEALQRYLNDIDKELDNHDTMSAAKLKLLKTEVKSKGNEVETMDNKALTKQWERILEKITASERIERDSVEYENVTDTIKRRLESPVNSPDTERPEFKRSKIPLALHSPAPIKKEIKEGGIRSRGSSLERRQRKDTSPMSDSMTSTMSIDSMEGSVSLTSVPSTPDTPRKDSSTFNLLKDSDLFTQISKNKIECAPIPEKEDKTKRRESDPCHVVAITEHEIVKSTVSPVEPMEITTDTVETVVEFIPQNVETVEIIDDTEGESLCDSDEESKSGDLGTEPQTFVVEVTTVEKRMKPTLGILKRKDAGRDKNKIVTVSEVPDIIPDSEDVSMKTPPPTPFAGATDNPLLYDLAVRQIEAQKNLMRDEVNEYLILDEVPKDQAALPEPSATETLSSDTVELRDDKPMKKSGVSISGSTLERLRRKSANKAEEEVIYSEVEDAPQARLSASDFDEKEPLSTSTPIKEDRKQVQVVAMSPKIQDDEVRKQSPSPILHKSHIPISKKAYEKYQRTDEYAEVCSAESTVEADAEAEAAAAAVRARFPHGADDAVLEFVREAEKMARRLHVVLLTVAAVPSERDPAKRLEILKNQLGSVAPDAAALISRGDSLVYDKHRDCPALATRLQQTQARLRAEWARVMAELDSKRRAALRAEDIATELNTLLTQLQTWCKDFEPRPENYAEMVEKETEIERLSELCRELRTQRVAYPERAASDVTSAYNRFKQTYDAMPKKDRKKMEGGEAEQVRRLNLAREAVAAAARALRAPPLAGLDYDDFPLQEDALERIKQSMEEVSGQLGTGGGEQARRLRDKLRAELAELRARYDCRREKWSECQTEWAALYAALEQEGEALDELESTLDAGNASAADVERLQAQAAERLAGAEAASARGAAVTAACSGRLARLVTEQLDALLHRARAAAQRASGAVSGRGAGSGAESVLRAVHALLLTTSANPSDRTSLAIRLSLVKAREEELAAAEKDTTDEKLKAELREAQSSVSAHADYVRGKLAALTKYSARLDAALPWAMETRARLALPPTVSMDRGELQTSINDKEAEIREVIENYNNIERECVAAKQTVSPEVRERVLKLKEDWAFIRAHAPPAPGAEQAIRDRESKSDREKSSSDRDSSKSDRESLSSVRESSMSVRDSSKSDRDVSSSVRDSSKSDRDSSSSVREVSSSVRDSSKSDRDSSERDVRSSPARERQSSDRKTPDRQEWCRSGSRRSPGAAALLANFDTSVLQIRDWLSAETTMLRAQPVTVGDVDEILGQLDKQKGVLRELEQKKPQLDELLHTAESLKGTENRQQLHGKDPKTIPGDEQQFEEVHDGLLLASPSPCAPTQTLITSTSDKASDNGPFTPELPPEILSALGDSTDDIPDFGEDIHPYLAERWTPILRKGLDGDLKAKLMAEYKIPANCTLLKSPTINPEISVAWS